MLKLFGGNGGSQTSRSTYVGKAFRVNEYQVVVEEVVAEGGFALVFQVRSSKGRRFALKRVAVNNQADLLLLRQEIAITKALSDCPHSVTYVSSAIHQLHGEVFEVLILLELYTGGRLVDLMNKRLSSGLTEGEVLKIFTDLCQSVARLHHRTKPITHRDLKVENVLRDKSTGDYILCDYGSCSVTVMHPDELGTRECEEEVSRFTTVAYRAPEMVSLYSGKPITTKADIWALGCLLYKLCFFTTPFGEQPLAIVSAVFTFPENSRYSQDLHSLIRYMLEPDPDKRPTIWQVCEVAFRLRKLANPVHNVFQSPNPPASLPSASPTSSSSSSSPPRKPQSTPASTKIKQLERSAVSSTSISSRERPRARAKPKLPRHISPDARYTPQSQLMPPITSPEHSKSMDSGLDAFGSVPFTSRHHQEHGGGMAGIVSDGRTDCFGSVPFTVGPAIEEVRKDLFGATPFSSHTPTDGFAPFASRSQT